MIVGTLGLQGAFMDHIPHLERLGAEVSVVRDRQGLQGIDRLILPGGESTVMAKFLKAYAMIEVLKERMEAGMPVWGVCAGAILLAREVDGTPGPLGALPVALTRNAYGRQRESHRRGIEIPLLDIGAYPASFIRAPRIDRLDEGVSVHATLDGDPVFVQSRRIMATTFHPELNPDEIFHHYFLSL